MRVTMWAAGFALGLLGGCDSESGGGGEADARVRADAADAGGQVARDGAAAPDGDVGDVWIGDVWIGDGPIPIDAAGRDSGAPPDAGPPPIDGAPPDDVGPALDAGLGPDAGDEPRAFRPIYAIDADFTEGGIYDPVDHAFYVGSLASGGVYRIDAASGAQATLFEPDEPGLWWTLGMAVDVVDHLLYVCAMDDRRELDERFDYAGYLWGFDLDTNERVLRIPLGDAAAGATCTDVAVADDGTVYINDRENPRLYVYDTDGALAVLVEDDALSGGIVGQNALVVLPDQTALLSLVYLPSRLVRVSLPDLRVSDVDIDGDFFDGLPALSGADGMTMSGDTLLVAFTSQLNTLRPILADWSRARSTTVDVPSGMTDVVHTPGGDYLLNGQAVDFAFGRDPDPSQLVRVE